MRRSEIYIPLLTLLIGGIIGWLLPLNRPFVETQLVAARGAVLRLSSAKFSYIKPLLACEIGTEETFPELKPIKKVVTTAVDEARSNKAIGSMSVYFRELNTSKHFTLNGDTKYAPASLLKVFVMMAFYKAANETDNPGLLEQRIAFEGSPDPQRDTPGEIIPHLKPGQFYTIDQLISQMIIYSDNDALNTLLDHIDKKTLSYFELVFKDLNISSPVTQKENDLNFMKVDEYALAFRVLYSSTYLSERYSERALALLSQAHYNGGIVAGVPSDTTVAHKFGDTTVTDSGVKSNELHDCGIVYYPNDPYFICIMTKGSSFSAQQDAIGQISATVYKAYDAYERSKK